MRIEAIREDRWTRSKSSRRLSILFPARVDIKFSIIRRPRVCLFSQLRARNGVRNRIAVCCKTCWEELFGFVRKPWFRETRNIFFWPHLGKVMSKWTLVETRIKVFFVSSCFSFIISLNLFFRFYRFIYKINLEELGLYKINLEELRRIHSWNFFYNKVNKIIICSFRYFITMYNNISFCYLY